MRKTALLIAALAGLPSAAQAADCKLQLLDIIKLEPALGGAHVSMPITVNGAVKKFLFDTGGSLTQVSRQATAIFVGQLGKFQAFEVWDRARFVFRCPDEAPSIQLHDEIRRHHG